MVKGFILGRTKAFIMVFINIKVYGKKIKFKDKASFLIVIANQLKVFFKMEI